MGDRNRKRRGSKKTHPVNNSSFFSEDKTPPTSPTTSNNFKNYQRRLRRSYSTGGESKHNTTNTISRSFKSQLQQRGRWHNFLEEFVPPVPHRFDADHDDGDGGGRATAGVNGGGNDASVTCRSPRRVAGNRRIYREQKSARNNNNNTAKSKRVPHKKSKRRAVRFDENTGLGLLRSWSDSDGGKLRVYAGSSNDDDDSSSSSSDSDSDSSSSSSSSNDGSSSSTGRVNRAGAITASNNIMMGARSSSLPPNNYYYRNNLVWGETETARQQQQQQQHYSHHGDTTIHSYYSQYQQRSRSFQYGDVYRRSDKDGKRNNLHPLAFFAEFLGEDLPPPPPATSTTRNQPQDSQVDVQSVMSSLGSYAEFLPEEEEEDEEDGNDELSQNDSLAYSSSSSVSLVQRSLLEEEENQEQQQQQQYPLTTEEEEQQQPTMVEYRCPQQPAMDEEQQQQQEHQQQFDTLRLLTRSTSPLTTIAEDSIETLSATSVSSPLDSSKKKKNKGNVPVNKTVKGTAGGNHHSNAVDTVFPSKRAYSRGSGSKGIKFRERFMYNWDDGLYDDNVVVQEKTSSSPIPLCAADVAAGVAAATNPTSSPNSVNNTDTAEDPSGSNDNITASSSSIEAYKRNETGSSLKTASTADSTVFSGMPTYSRHHSATSQSSAYTFSSMKSYLSQSQIRNLEDAPPELVDVLNQQLSILKTRRQDILDKAKLRNDKSSRKKLNIDDSIRVENSIQFSLFVMKDKVEQLQDILGPLSVEVF